MKASPKLIHSVIVLISAFAGWISPEIYGQDNVDWTLQPFSEALKLVKVYHSSDRLTFVLQNSQEKIVTGYAACFSRGERFSSCHTSDWATSDSLRGLARGEVDYLIIGDIEAAEYPNHILRISAVLFEDGSSEGLYEDIMCIYLKRLGKALESGREALILSSFTNPSLSDVEITALANKIGPPIEKDSQLPDVLKDMEGYGITVPNVSDLSGIMRGSLESGISITRTQTLRDIDLFRKSLLSSTAAQGHIKIKTIEELMMQMKETASRLIELSRQTEKQMKGKL